MRDDAYPGSTGATGALRPTGATEATDATQAEGTTRAAPARLLGLSWVHFLNDGAANYLPGVLPAVLVSLDQPVRVAGALMAALSIGQTTQPLMGWIADRLGGRSMIVIGLLASSLGGAMIGRATSMGSLIAFLVLIGLGSSMFHPQAVAAVRTLAPARQGFLTSAFLVGGELGRGIWPTVASLIGTSFGLRSLWIVAIPALVSVPFLWRWAPRLPSRPRAVGALGWRQQAYPLVLLVGYRGLRALVTAGLVTFVPILWHLRGGSLVGGASIVTTMLVIGVIGNLAGGHLTDTLGRRPILLLSAVAMSVFIVPLALVHGVWIWVFAALIGIAMFLSASTTVLIGQDMFPGSKSMGSGIAMGLANGVGAILVLVLGLWVSASSLMLVFWVLTAVGLLSGLMALGFPTTLMSAREQA
ncbi:MAG: MFS transporter [Deinococcales bacterium]